ncbi:MAG: class II aldolase/adducin family protein, partial [Candidatus Omnitrophota bacterium]
MTFKRILAILLAVSFFTLNTSYAQPFPSQKPAAADSLQIQNFLNPAAYEGLLPHKALEAMSVYIAGTGMIGIIDMRFFPVISTPKGPARYSLDFSKKQRIEGNEGWLIPCSIAFNGFRVKYEVLIKDDETVTLRCVGRDRACPVRKTINTLVAGGSPILAPSILNVAPDQRVAQAARAVAAGKREGIRVISHFDVIDANEGRGSKIVQAGAKDTVNDLPPEKVKEIVDRSGGAAIVDVHLMVMGERLDRENMIERYIENGAGIITLHWEAYESKDTLLERLRFIKANGVMSGLAFNPDVNAEEVGRFLQKHGEEADMILQMSVFPGKGGQSFREEVLDNIPLLKVRYGYRGAVEIDGGINSETIKKAADAGVNIFVAGSAFYKPGVPLGTACRSLKKPLDENVVYKAIRTVRMLLDKAESEGLLEAKVSVRAGDYLVYMDSERPAPVVVPVKTKLKPDDLHLAAHLRSFKKHKEANVIIQAMGDAAGQVTASGMTVPPVDPDFVAILNETGPLPVLGVNDKKLPNALCDEFSRHNAVLTAGGWIFTKGTMPMETYYRNKLVEDSSKLCVAARAAGRLKQLTTRQADLLLRTGYQKHRQALLRNAAIRQERKTVPVPYDEEEIRRLRQRLIAVSRKIADEGLVVGPGGNISMITSDRRIVLIKASGKSFEDMKPEEYIGVDLETGMLVEGLGELKPSTEVTIHCALYRSRPDIQAVVHTHPPVATGIASANTTFLVNGQKARRIGYVTPGGPAFARAVSGNMLDTDYLTITGHGSVTVGKDLDEAFVKSVELEKAAEGRINMLIFQRHFHAYKRAMRALSALSRRKIKDAAVIKEIFSLKNKAMYALEELILESEKKKVRRVSQLSFGDILYDIDTKACFAYTGPGSLSESGRSDPKQALREGRLIVIKPLSIRFSVRQERDRLIRQLTHKEIPKRMEALAALKEMVRKGILPKPHKTEDIFMHCHTTYSFSPYTPSWLAWRGYQLGLKVVGIVDHDTVAGFGEFRAAGKIV